MKYNEISIFLLLILSLSFNGFCKNDHLKENKKRKIKISTTNFLQLIYAKGDKGISSDPIDEFWRFCKMRQLRYEQRKKNFNKDDCFEGVLNENRVLNEAKFTNVYREQDRGTIGVLNFLKRCMDEYPGNNRLLFYNALVARYLNRPEALERIGPLDPEQKDQLREAIGKKKLMNMSAYFIPANFTKLYLGIKNHYDMIFRYIPEKKLEKMWTAFNRPERDIKKKIEAVNTAFFHYKLEFLLLQVFADLSILKPDWINPKSMPPLGPGARPTLRLIKEISHRNQQQLERVTDESWMIYLKQTQAAYWPGSKPLTLVNLEHALCEWHKYLKYHFKLEPIPKNKRFKENENPLPLPAW